MWSGGSSGWSLSQQGHNLSFYSGNLGEHVLQINGGTNRGILLPNLLSISGGTDLIADGTVVKKRSSSARYKHNIKSLRESYPNSIKLIDRLQPVTFSDVSDLEDREFIGLIAEEVYKVAPELVILENGRPESVCYHAVPMLLIDAIKEQQEIIENQQDQLDDLALRLSRLENNEN